MHPGSLVSSAPVATMVELEIDAMTLGPFAVGHLDGKSVMVANAVPGDRLEATIEQERSGYARARLDRVVRASADRREPPCPYLPRCGGCDWQHVLYPAQLRLKGELIASTIGRALDVAIDPIGLVAPAPQEFAYRSRIRLQVGAGALGFHEFGSNRLVEIERCIVGPEGIRIPRPLAAALGAGCNEIEVVQSGAREVLVAHLRGSISSGQIARAQSLLAIDAAIAGIVLRTTHDRVVVGDAEIAIELEPGIDLRVAADLFSQVNQEQNRRLIEAVLVIADLRRGDAVLDLFCGAGNFSLPAARRGAKVMGVDAQAPAIEAAARNAARLGLSQARFSAMPAEDIARFLLRARYRADLIILDPPRAGAAELMPLITRMRAPRVLYVSCDAATLARDLKILAAGGYRLERLRAFDFFPNTHHAEIVAHLLLT